MKNKTIAAWLAFVGGPLGLHRFYLKGPGDMLGWLLPIPTALGLYGIERAGRLTGRRFFGDKDWYRVGCEYLVAAQNRDGSWGGREMTVQPAASAGKA